MSKIDLGDEEVAGVPLYSSGSGIIWVVKKTARYSKREIGLIIWSFLTGLTAGLLFGLVLITL